MRGQAISDLAACCRRRPGRRAWHVLAGIVGMMVNLMTVAGPPIDVSLALEASAARQRGVAYLVKQQLCNGSWANHPAITSLAALALANSTTVTDPDSVAAAVDNALRYLRVQAHDDGSIWNVQTQQYPVYSTAISLLAIVRMNQADDTALLAAARHYLLSCQCLDVPATDLSYGGFRDYPGAMPNLTLSQWVLEALYLTDRVHWAKPGSDIIQRHQTFQVYTSAITFISRCQLLTADVTPLAYGSFNDFPVSAATSSSSASVPGTPRSRAFLTAAGVKSLLYSTISSGDPTVQAGVAWLAQNYSVQRNGELGSAGYYTYLYTLSKTLQALAAGQAGNFKEWRHQVVLALLQRQHGNGSWSQPQATEWWENNPELVTAYSLLSLGIALSPNFAIGP